MEVEVEQSDNGLFEVVEALPVNLNLPLLLHEAYHPVVGRLDGLFKLGRHQSADYGEGYQTRRLFALNRQIDEVSVG